MVREDIGMHTFPIKTVDLPPLELSKTSVLCVRFTDLKAMEERVDAMDRISELPAFINHHIMSFLSPKEVAETRILSKKWKHLCETFPILDFDQTYFVRFGVCQENFRSRRKIKRCCELIEKFTKFVDASLLRFCKFSLCIQKFRLFISVLDVKQLSSVLDRWIGLAVEYEVKELDFEVVTDRDTVYHLPETIFSAKLVNTLRLGGCKLDQPSDPIRFWSLKKLVLDRVCISEQMVVKLISDCSLLEDLSFSNCWGLRFLCVSKAPKLKIMSIKADIEGLETVEISVSSLQELNLKFRKDQTPRVVDFAGCTYLRKLKVVSLDLMDQDCCQLMTKFALLEDLFLLNCYTLEILTISSNQLKKLKVACCKSIKALNLDTPNLLSFAYESNPIPTSSVNALCQWKVRLCPDIVFDTQWCLNLREFLGVKNQIEALIISVKPNTNSFNLEKFREACPSLPCKVENLDVYIDVPPSDCRIMLDGLFCICYPRTLSVYALHPKAQHELFKSLYSELKGKDVQCCNSQGIKCWRHYLKDVRIKFLQFGGNKPSDIDDLIKMHNTHSLMDIWPILPRGSLRIHLDWCSPVFFDEA